MNAIYAASFYTFVQNQPLNKSINMSCKILFASLSYLFLNLSCADGKVNDKGSDTTASVPHAKTDISKTPVDTIITFSAVGDIMFGSNFPDKSKMPPDEGKNLLSEASDFLKATGITFGNLEGTLLDSGGVPKGVGQNIYCFRQPVKYVNLFKENGFNLLSIANNHINDFGPVGIETTIKTLQTAGLNFAGTPTHPYIIFDKGSLKIGMIAFAPHAGCLNLNDIANATKLVKEAKAKCDILMVSFHGGAEGEGHQRVTRKREFFFGQDRGDVYEFAHQMIDSGADLVIGHGPHVVRGMEVYKSRLIAYSLGNFCTYGMFSLSGSKAFAPLLQFELDHNGKFNKGKIISFLQLGEGGPVKDANNAAAKRIKELSQQDFPESKLQIDDEGNLSYIE
ncbi:MAG: CapA family protein [Ferruginibacter sp.]|nr:CapA family protein [Ferruginibacter sp.]